MCNIFIKANIIQKLAYKVKYICQINRGLMFFLEIQELEFLEFVASIVNKMKKRINSRKRTQSRVQHSKFYDDFHIV